MSALNNARTLSALNVKASTAMPAAAKAQPQPSAQNDSSRDTFSRMLERSRADAAAERHASSPTSRPDTRPASDAQAARHAAKEAESRRRDRTESSDADARADDANTDDTRTRASAASRGRGADTARPRADRAADDDASAESIETTRPAADEEATRAQADATPADVMPTLAAVMPPVAPTVTPVARATTGDAAAAADPALTDATGAAISPLALSDPAGGRIGWAGAMRANASHAAPEAAGDSKDGPAFGLAQPVPAPASPAPDLVLPTQPAVPEAALAQLAALSGHTGPTDETRKLPSALDVLPAGSSAALAHPGAALSRAGDSPALPTATVSTAVTDPGFQEALATQVSVFARGGLSKAELHLNPAELGPVSVQITMQGDQARVDFGADRAQTRQAIEAGWAALAASLQDAGFTLSGGGVSEQAGRQAAEQQAAAQTGRSSRATTTLAADDLPATSIVAARPRAGAALDLYA